MVSAKQRVSKLCGVRVRRIFLILCLLKLSLAAVGASAIALSVTQPNLVTGKIQVSKSLAMAESHRVQALRQRLGRPSLDPGAVPMRSHVEAVVRFSNTLDPAANGRLLRSEAGGFVVESLRAVPSIQVQRTWKNLSVAVVTLDSVDELDALLNLPGALVLGEPEIFVAETANLELVGSIPANLLGADGSGSVVAIVDTGVDYTSGAFGSCVSVGSPGCAVVRSVDTAIDDGQLDASNQRHGTHVSAVALAVAPKSTLAVYDVFSGSSASTVSINTAIDDIVTQKLNGINIVVANFSLGVPVKLNENCETTQDLDALLNAGILPVVSAGNSTPGSGPGTFAPACHPGAVGVGAVYDTAGPSLFCDPPAVPDHVLCQSNYGRNVDLLAPGFRVGGGGTVLSGTSSASPHVAGAVAALRSAGVATSLEAFRLLAKSGVSVVDERDGQRIPRLQLEAALALFKAPNEIAEPNDRPSGALELGGAQGTMLASNFGAIAEEGGIADPDHRVWFRLVLTASGTLTLSTRYSNFDTRLTASSQGSTFIDNNSGIGGTSELAFQVLAGSTVLIGVSGEDSAVGRIQLEWNLVEPTRSPFLSSGPTRILDSRRSGVPSDFGGTVKVQLPADRFGQPKIGDLAQLTVVATGASEPGFLAATVCGAPTPTSQLNWRRDADASNVVYAPVSAEGQVCLSVSGSTQLVMDYYGRFRGAAVAPNFTRRLVDSRSDVGSRLTPENLSRQFRLTNVNASFFRMVNITVTNSRSYANIVVGQCGYRQSEMLRSIPSESAVATSLILIGLSEPSVCIQSDQPTDVIIDEVASIYDFGTSSLSYESYLRAQGNNKLAGILLDPYVETVLAIPTPASQFDRSTIVRMSIDATQSSAGWVSVRSCGRPFEETSVVNYSAGERHAAVLTLPVGPLCFLSSSSISIVVAKLGGFASDLDR
jgi:subtilisin family serine protease